MKKILLVSILLIGLVGCNDDVDKGLAAEREGNYQDAEKIYSKSCNSHNGDACFYLAEMYLNGKGVKQNTSKATDLYIKGCNEGGGKACYHIGDLYVDGRDLFEAVRYYQKACDFEDWSGCWMISANYKFPDCKRNNICNYPWNKEYHK